MKKGLLLLFAVLMLALFFSTAEATVQEGTCGSNLSFYLDYETGMLTINGSGPMYDKPNWNRQKIRKVILPEGLTSIGENAFLECYLLTDINLPLSLKTIGDSAFCSCENLPSVDLPNGLQTIGEQAFYDCSRFMEIEIPASTEVVKESAFQRCDNLTHVTFWGTDTYVEYDAFDSNSNLTISAPEGSPAHEYVTYDYHIKYDLLIVSDVPIVSRGNCGESLKWALDEEGKLIFAGSGEMEDFIEHGPWGTTEVKQITLPYGVTKIGANAFHGCSAIQRPIVMPYTLQNVGENAFTDCNVKLIAEPETNAASAVSRAGFPFCTDGGDYLLQYRFGDDGYQRGLALIGVLDPSISEAVIPQYVKTIGNGAFRSCTNLRSVEFTDSFFSSIEEYAFAGCTALQNFEIPDRLIYIAANTFDGCSSLSNVVISDSVRYIHDCAFKDCTALHGIDIPDGVEAIGQEAFCRSGLTRLLLPSHLKTMGTGAFKDCKSLANTDVQEGVTTIGVEAFSGCEYMTYIDLPASVTVIGELAFSGCDNLGDVLIRNPEAVIGNNAFSIADSVGLKLHAFRNSSTLTYAEHNGIPFQTLVDIVDQGTCGENLNWTRDRSGLLTISGTGDMFSYENESQGPWAAYINGVKGIDKAVLEEGVTGIGKKAFRSISTLNEVELPETLTHIDESAFEYCTALTDIELPDGLMSLADSAFRETAVPSMIIPSNLTEIGYSLFPNATVLYTDPESMAAKALSDKNYYFRALDSTDCYSWYYSDAENPDAGVLIGCVDRTIVQFTVPTEILGRTVTQIGNCAFMGCEALQSVVIPEGITSIGSSAFYQCANLSDVNIPQGVSTIGTSAFFGCNALTHINIPDSVIRIEWSAFRDSGLTSIDLPASVNAIWDNTFTGCSDLSTVHFSGNGQIGGYAFQNCTSLENVEITDCSSIGEHAFDGCSSLEELVIPVTTNSISDWAFLNCNALTRLTLKNKDISLKSDKAFRGCTNLILVGYDGSTAESFAEANDLPFESMGAAPPKPLYWGKCGENMHWTQYDDGHVVIEGTGEITSFGWENSILTSIEIPEGVTSIPQYAFRGASKLTEFHIPTTVTTIGDYAFGYCSGLTELEIPDNVTSIGNYVFEYCTGLAEIHLPEDLNIIGEGMFRNCTSLETLDIPQTVISIEPYAFQNCTGLQEIALPEGVTTIGYWAFSNCESLRDVVLPDTLTTLQRSAFENCISLQEIQLPSSLKIVDYESFKGSGLIGVVIPAGATKIDSFAFENCANLLTADIPRTVTSISYHAFGGCGQLESVFIRNKYTSLGIDAFVDCPNLTLYGYIGSTTEACATENQIPYVSMGYAPGEASGECGEQVSWHLLDTDLTISGTGAMEDYYGYGPWGPEITSVTIEEGVTRIGNHAFSNCEQLTSVNLSDSLTEIGNFAFSNCTALPEIQMHNNLTLIGEKAFAFNTSLTEVNIPISVNQIGRQAFSACKNLERVTILNRETEIGYNVFENDPKLIVYGYEDSTAYEAAMGSGAIYVLLSEEGDPKIVSRGTCGNNTTWNLNDDGLLTIEGEGAVTSHGWSSCSERDTICRVVISDGVTSLCNYAFNEMGSIESAELPDSLESIGKRAFHFCYSMKSVRMSTGLTVLGEGAFYQCESLEEIDLPQGLTTIPDNAFVYCEALTRVGIPDSVQSIGEYAFNGCSALEEMTVPEGVTEIKISTFDHCESLRRVDLPSTLNSIEQSAFDSCKSLEQINLPDGVNYINGLAFARCTSMKSFTFPKDLTSVYWELFKGAGLESVVLPKTISSIDELAFSQCTNLGEVTVYNARAYFASSDIFEDSPNVRLKGYDSSTAQAYATAHGIPFESMGEIPYVVVKSGTCGKNLNWTLDDYNVLRVTGSGAMKDYFYITDDLSPWAYDAVEAILPEGLTHIGTNAFYYPYYNYALQSVNIPSTVKSIGRNAFALCRNLAEITIPMGVEEIGATAFYCAYALKEVDLPESVAIVGDQAFYYCRALERVTIRNRYAQIGSDAFINCDGLTLCGRSGSTAQAYAEANNIPFEALPAEWDAPVYAWSENLDSVTATRYFDGDLTHFETETVPVTRALSIAPTETTAGEALYSSDAFENPAFEIQTAVRPILALCDMDVLYLPDDLLVIEASAFENLSCQAVIVPQGCAEIGERAFAGSGRLLYVRLPQSAVVAVDAFDGCDALMDYFE